MNKNNLKKKYFYTGNKRISYYDTGEGMPVFFIHGFGVSSELWVDVLLRLTEAGFRCIAPDLIGFGDSTAPLDAKFGVDYHIDTLFALYKDLCGMEPPILVGHGFGATLALVWAIHRPGFVKKLVVSDVFFYSDWPVGTVKRLRMAAGNDLLWKLAVKSGFLVSELRKWIKRGVSCSRKISADKTESFIRPFLLSESARNRLRKNLNDVNPDIISNLSSYVRKIKVPVFILRGSENPYVKLEYFTQLATDIPDSVSFICPETGFFSPLEVPDLFSSEILKFLS